MWRCQEVSFYVGFVAGWDAQAGRGCGQQARSVGGWSGWGFWDTQKWRGLRHSRAGQPLLMGKLSGKGA